MKIKVEDKRDTNQRDIEIGSVYERKLDDGGVYYAMVCRPDMSKFNLIMLSQDTGNRWTENLHKQDFLDMLHKDNWVKVNASMKLTIE